MNDWYEQFKNTPFFDAHSHVAPRKLGRSASYETTGVAKSKLAGLLLGYGSRLCFLASGMSSDEIERIYCGNASAGEAKTALLKYLSFVKTSLPVVYCRRGLELMTGRAVDMEDDWDFIEDALNGAAQDDAKHLTDIRKRDGIADIALNLWTSLGAPYFSSGIDGAFHNIATLDSHAIAKDTTAAALYARSLETDISDFDGYDAFLDKVVDFVHARGAQGIKISETYYRAPDYAPAPREKAKTAFEKGFSPAKSKELSDYVTRKIVARAGERALPVQIHTGELWGDARTSGLDASCLEPLVSEFSNVKFDLLHGSYPYMAQLGILAANRRNVYLNLAYMPLRSLDMFCHWLDVYQNTVSSDRILLGTDVFDTECMAGCVDFIRLSCAELASRMERRAVASRKDISELFERIFYRNARELYYP